MVPKRPPVPSAPPFLGLVGHPLRWRLLAELARSDRKVAELVRLTGQPQSLVSYHLGRLRAGRLVTARRSSLDGRDSYYHLDLAHYAEELAATGTALHPALHPGLWPRPARHATPSTGALVPAGPLPPPAQTATPATGPRRARRAVLFLCTGNSSRSPMAEALLRRRAGDRVEVTSAGTHPKPLHPNTLRVMRDYGIDLTGRGPRHLDTLADRRFDQVISLCDKVREACPPFPGDPVLTHWSLPDPAAAAEDEAAGHPAFQRTAAELDARIRFLLPTLTLEGEAQ
ncbi:MarR family transcriptional regulator [Sphaerisporangium sp. NPDC005289]|uniref:arsenate reductase/protein-tyrosine-phosphatase family protein n=1 Tax=Sphaerisporangium sp. NPDC005289 TaxID=3155247 RepID=UPI0033A4185B